MADEKGDGETILDTSASSEHDPHFEPIITLPEVVVPTMEEEEEELLKLRAKLFRYDTNENPPEWKERGVGDIKLLRHRANNRVRVVMRRDKTHKICANHYVAPWMELKPNCNSDKAWVYSVAADYADEFIQPQLLAIRFGNPENAKKWKDKFEEAKSIVMNHAKTIAEAHYQKKDSSSEDESDEDSEKENGDTLEESDLESKKKESNDNEETTKLTENLEKLDVSVKDSDKLDVTEKNQDSEKSHQNGDENKN